MTTNLYAALVKAQADVRPVEKDSRNKAHDYKYASGDDVIAAARVALNANGLAVCALRWQVTETPTWYIDWQPDPTDPLPADHKEKRHVPVKVEDLATRLAVFFRLIHESGEVLDFDPFGVPVLPGKGRPIDKAEAGARTYALSYFLRDLLLIPRVDEGTDVDSRDDRGRAPVGRREAPPQATALRRPAEQPQATAPAPTPTPDPKRAEAEAALARCLAAYPAARAEIETAYHEATSGGDALSRLRRIYARLAAVKPQLPQRDTSQAEIAARITQIVALLDRDGLAAAAAQVRETISEYGAELGVPGIANADLPGCLGEVEAIANAALAEVAA